MLMLWVTLIAIQTRQRLEIILLITTLSITFYGYRGAIFTLLHGGQHRVHGPHTGFFWDNNAVGLAMSLVIPLLRYFYLQATNNVLKLFYMVSIFATILSVVATYSRGSVLGMVVSMIYLFLKTRHRFRWLLIFLPVFYGILVFMPESWVERMHSISNYEQDRASTGRLIAWQTAINIAADRPWVGGGFSVMTRRIFYRYSPDPTNFHDFHSIYFEVLGEQGYPGLIFFLGFFITCYRYGSLVIRHCRTRPDLAWMKDLAAMIQVSLVAYASAGFFLGMAYFDLPWHIAVFMIILRTLAIKALSQPATIPADKTLLPTSSTKPFNSIFDAAPYRG